MSKKTTTSGLARALRSRIGRVCWFRHDDGSIIEGVYTRGRKVTKMTGVSRFRSHDGTRGFDVDETVYSVPRHIKITFGQAPV